MRPTPAFLTSFASFAFLFAWTMHAHAQQPPTTAPANPLAGVIDFHSHTGPDVVGRSITEFDLARLARRVGMRGIVIKSHYLMTADRAQVVMQEIGGGIEVFGGVALNRSVGGINPAVVQRMVEIDGRRGKLVWLPTFDAENQARFSNDGRPFVPVIRDGKPVPEFAEIFKTIAANDLVLATGHSAADESLILIDAAKKAGVRKIVVTHALADPIAAKDEQLKRMAEMGAIIECVWLNTIGGGNAGRSRLITIGEYARVIKLIGAEHFLIASDLGQRFNPVHTDGMLAFINGLKGEGLSERDIDVMARRNPARLLGLE